MISRGGSGGGAVRQRRVYRVPESAPEDAPTTRPAEDGVQAVAEAPSAEVTPDLPAAAAEDPSTQAGTLSVDAQLAANIRGALRFVTGHVRGHPALAVSLSAAAAAVSLAIVILRRVKHGKHPKKRGAAPRRAKKHAGKAVDGSLTNGHAAAAADASTTSAPASHPADGASGHPDASSTARAKPAAAAKKSAAAGDAAARERPGRFAKLRPTVDCVPLADGSACVVRRKIAADNSCLFNAVGYAMHHSKTRAPFLRSVVSREVSSDPTQYTAAFLNMPNPVYCNWIMEPGTWGGAIELFILAKHYNREISAWNIETQNSLVFGEEAGYKKRAMVIYNGVHYDVLAIAEGPRADPANDVTEFNPRTKRGKMIVAAAQTLTTLNHQQSSFVSPTSPRPLKCTDCGVQVASQSKAMEHAQQTGHQNFEQLKS